MEGLDKKDDFAIWDFALKNKYTVVTQDADLSEIGILKGYPPKIIWLRCGNTSTKNIEHILSSNFQTIEDFIKNLPQGCLELIG